MAMGEPPLRRCLVGGTFDRFHIGHEVLLSTALRHAEKIEVWVCDDKMARQKSPLVEDYERRSTEVVEWLQSTFPDRFSIHTLDDEYGPARTRHDCDSIACTVETQIICERINSEREMDGLAKLEIITVPHVEDALGGVVSSTRIRAGIIDRRGQPWVSDELALNSYRMVASLEAELKAPLGEVFTGPESTPEVAMGMALEQIIIPAPALIAVGDVTVQTLLDMDIIPDVAVVDGQTKRAILDESEYVDEDFFEQVLKAENPAGILTPSLFIACRDALASDLSTLIIVDGEEDLAPMYLHRLAPLGAVILYGQPRQGVVLRLTDEVVKQRCRSLLDAFEVL